MIPLCHAIACGDVLEVLRGVPENTFHGMLSDPPYGLSFMGKDWDKVVPGREVWAECLRVLRPGAYVLVFGGTRTFHRLAVAMEDAGFEIRDVLSWMYGSGFPKSTNVSLNIDAHLGVESKTTGSRVLTGNAGVSTKDKGGTYGVQVGSAGNVTVATKGAASPEGQQWSGYGTALKPAWEPVILARKPLDGTIAANVLKWGCGALAIDACRIGNGEERDVFARTNTKSANGFGTIMSSRSTTGETTTLGRFPANVILDEEAGAHLDDVVGTVAKPKAARTGRIGGMGGAVAFDGLKPDAIGTWPADPGGGPSRFFKEASWSASTAELSSALESLRSGSALALAAISAHPAVVQHANPFRALSTNVIESASALSDERNTPPTPSTVARYLLASKRINMFLSDLARSVGTLSPIDTTRITTTLETFDSYAELATFESTPQNSEPGAPASPVSRFHYSAKVSTKERNAGLDAFPVLSGGEATDREDGSDGLESPRAGAGRTGGNRNPHPTLKPIALAEYLAKLLLPPGPSTLLVPFSGTGSEMIGALKAGWSRVLGVELDPSYIEIAEARIKEWCK